MTRVGPTTDQRHHEPHGDRDRPRRLVPVLALVALLAAGGAASAQAPRAGAPAGGENAFSVAPAASNPAGPLFALEPLVARLGGELRLGAAGEGRVLVVAGLEVVFGPGGDAAIVDRDVVRLTQPVAADAAGGLLVPLDFLAATWGDLAGVAFDWNAAEGRLAVVRAPGRELAVGIDLVHLQGVSTVVLQFPETPRYRVTEVPGGLEVQLQGTDRVAAGSRVPPGADPLVRGVRLAPDRIRIELVPGAAAEHYRLLNPFRLVFDVHRAAAGAGDSAPAYTPAPPEREGVRTIVLDPGHGGSETGAMGSTGVAEKELTLVLGQALKAALERKLAGVRVLLTRDEDAFLPLDTRAALANQNKADLFVSLHLNSTAVRGRGAHGAETYFLSLQASDARAAQAAERENLSPADGGEAGEGTWSEFAEEDLDLQLILWDLAQSHHLAASQRLAKLIQEELNTALDLRDRGVKQAPFRVLMGAAMPAVLVELGFLSNPDEEAKLQDPVYRAELVAALVRAIGRYKALVEGLPDPAAAAPGGGGPVEGTAPPARPAPGGGGR